MQKLSSVGYVFFHRHGHRAPIKNIFKSPLELKLWESMLPDSSAVQDLSVKYPIVTHESIVTQPDCQSKPFGYLTKPGMDHLKLTGRKAREMFPSLENISTIEAYSTNYRRTQISAQSFLTGLQAPSVPVVVREPSLCSMSFFEGKADLARVLTKKVQSTSYFQEKENLCMQSIGYPLLTFVPELATERLWDTTTSNAPSPLETKDKIDSPPVATASAVVDETREEWKRSEDALINWMAAIDYFHCRKAHQVPYKSEVAHLEKPLESYVGSRYRDYFSHSEHRAHSVLPILKDAYKAIKRILENRKNVNLGGSSGVGVTVFSGHDVNILAVLHALDATIVKHNIAPIAGGAGPMRSHWPDYGSVIALEVMVEEENEASLQCLDGAAIILRVFYNHQPLEFTLSKDEIVTAMTLQQLREIFQEIA